MAIRPKRANPLLVFVSPAMAAHIKNRVDMASDNEIERLKVTLELDYQTYLKDVEKAVDAAVRKLKDVDEAPKKAKTYWEQLSGFLKGQFMNVITGVGVAIAAAFSVQAVTNFFRAIAGGMVETNKQFENFETQLTTLLGSQSEAKKRITELATFAQKTPFELDKVVESSRLLQTFGGDALAVGDNLRRVGDTAAAVNADFERVSFHVGRMYSALMSGRPFGEAAQELMQMGAISGATRNKMEDMAKAGEDGAKIWAVYAAEMDKNAGAMDRMSKTLTGVLSNLNDFKDALLRKGGEALFEGLRDDAGEFYDILSDPAAEKAITDVAKALGAIFDSLREAITSPILEQIKEIDPARAQSLADSMAEIAGAVDNLSGQKIGNLSDLVTMTDTAASTAASLLQTLNILKDISFAVSGFTTLGTGLDNLGETGNQIKEAALGALFPLKGLSDTVEALTGSNLNEWLGATTKNLNEVATAGDHAFNALQEGARKAAEAAQAPELTPIDDPKAREAFAKSAQELRDLQEELGEKREEIEQEHGERVIEINENYQEELTELEEETAEKRADILKDSAEELADLERGGAKERIEIAEDTADRLAELEEDTAKARAKAEESARESLAELETETQTQVAQVQEDAQEKERQALQDHQRELRQLHDNYLLDLEGAVTNRDARAIVDLRRRYQSEKQTREEDFQVQRSRAREETEKRLEEAREAERKKQEEIKAALDEQLEDIKENEEEKKQEILDSQAEQLTSLAEKEAERKAQIAADQAEELAKLEESEAEKRAKLEESLNEQLAKEAEHHAESLAALDETLQKWQEKTAEAWAEIEGLTESGAQAAFAAMEAIYGPDGSAAQMWDAYFARLQQQAADMATFNQQLATPSGQGIGPPTGQGGTTSESAGGAGIPQFAEGGIVPGRPGQKRLIIAHAGELVIPPDQTSQWLSQQGDMMASNLDNSPKVVELKVSGSAPPGIGGSEVESIAGTLVQALNEAGIRTRRR